LIVIHDQRGSGKSTPFAEIKDNTSQALVADIEQLRAHLDISTPVSIFAGSWGSTLALLYAEAFPQNVSRMILRGAFTCTWEAQDYFYSEKGAAIFSPRAWDRLIKTIPPGPGRIQEKIHRLIEEADETGKRKLCKILAEYEYSFFNIVGEELEKLLSGFETYFSEMRINMHYQANRFFLEDQQILKNAGKIAAIPVTLIHGSRDVVCPPAFAWELHRRLPNSQFILVADAGHLSSHPQIRTALLQALSRWE
jgi:proline iminopeptidase